MLRSLAFVFAFSLALPCLAGSKQLPDDAALQASKRLIIESFRKELSAPDKLPAIRAMLDTADKTEGDDAGQAALYLSAADVAARAGETKLAFEALEQLAQTFQVDLLALKLTAIQLAGKHAKSSESRVSVANRCLELADDAARANRFEVADDALKTAASTAAKVRDAELRKEIATKRRDIDRARRQEDHAELAMASAQKTLKEKPSDPEANEVLGKHLAFDRNDWSAGLKHLTKASDSDLRRVAAGDLAGSADQAKALGDQWWALGDAAANDRDRAGYRSRAVFWYTRAVGSLTGLQKTLLEKRIAEAGEQALTAAADQTGGEGGKFVDVTLAPGVLMRLVKVPASADGKVKEFYLGQTEVTQKQWQAVMGSKTANFDDDTPVIWVTLTDAKHFCEAIGKTALGSRYTFRIPTHREWLHAAAMTADEAAMESSAIAWTITNAKEKVQPVATKKSNKIGLFDMLGNAWEWSAGEMMMGLSCSDKGNVASEVFRGFDSVPPPEKNYKGGNVGFRVAASLK